MARNPKPTSYRCWLTLFALLGIALHLGIWFVFQIDLEPNQPAPRQDAFIFYQSEGQKLGDDLLLRRAFLFDSEPIFLPTARNYSGPVKTDASIWEPEVDLSKPFDPDIRLDDSILLAAAQSKVSLGNPEEILKKMSGDFFSEFAVSKKEWTPVERHGLYVEASDAGGNLVVKSFISLETTPSFSLAVDPVVFSILHTPFGVGGEPLLVSPSGDEETDIYLRKILLENVRPLLQGMTGYFQVKIGP